MQFLLITLKICSPVLLVLLERFCFTDTADYPAQRLGAVVVADSEEICDEALKLIGEV